MLPRGNAREEKRRKIAEERGVVTGKIIDQLGRIVGAEHVQAFAEERLCYSYDASGAEGLPAVVVHPGCTAEVSALLALATRERVPVVPRGAGSGMTGGALSAGGMVLAMDRFNRILEIDADNQVAVVEPGVVTGEFKQAVAARGLFYPPDPASLAFCTMGGNVGNCAGGPSAVKYGVTRDYVLGLEVVLPDGAVTRTGVRTAKGVVGYDLTRLFVGSEGTLGVVTSITVRLLARPTARTTCLLAMGDLRQAASLVARLLAAGILPATLEYMDRTAISVVADRLPFDLPAGCAALLLVEFDGDPESVRGEERRLEKFLEQHGEGLLATLRAADQAEADRLWAARRAISPATFALRPHKISEDVVVPRTRIPDLVAFAEELAATLELTILTFGHAGDGNIHVNIMIDRGDEEELKRGEEARTRLFQEVVRLGGTLSGEHGVGLSKAPFLALELDPAGIRVMRAIKNALDPHNIMNPGKIFPEMGEV